MHQRSWPGFHIKEGVKSDFMDFRKKEMISVLF